METKEAIVNHPEGVEVKLSTKNLNLRVFIGVLIMMLIGSLLYIFIWEEFSAYGLGHRLGSIAKTMSSLPALASMASVIVIYILFQAGLFYWFGGKDWKALRWQADWKSFGLALNKPIALKYYRMALLLPGIVVGVLPAIHGFCTGNAGIFYLGVFGIAGALGDFTFCHKLRPFDDEDLLVPNRESFQATIIKRNYGKSDK